MPNKGYKKLIALLSASAMIVSIIPSVAFADDTESLSEVAVVETELEEATAEDIIEVEDNDFGATDIINVDYTSADATDEGVGKQNDDISWTLSTVDGLHIVNGNTGKTRNGHITFDEIASGMCLIEYTADLKCYGDNASTIGIGNASKKDGYYTTEAIKFSMDKYGANGKLNGTSIVTNDGSNSSSRTTGKLSVRHIIDIDAQTFTTVIKSSKGTELYNATDNFSTTDVKSISHIQFALGKYNDVKLYNLKISQIEMPVVDVIEGLELEAGQQDIVATVSNVTDVEVTSSDNTFEVGYDSSTGEIFVTAPSSGELRETTITIKAIGDVTVTKTVTVKYVTDEGVVSVAKDTLDIAAGNDSVTKNGTAYDVVGNFTLPESPNSAQITWSATVDGQDDEDIIKIDGNEVIIGIVEGSQVVVLTATITKGSSTDTKTFTLNLPTKQEKLNAMVDALELSGDNVVKNENGTYTISGAFTVASTDEEVAEVSYAWSTVDTDKLSVNGTDITPVVYGNATASLTVNAVYGDATASKTFNLILDSTKTFYDEDFEDWAADYLVVAHPDGTNYTTKATYDGWSFTIASRNEGGTDRNNVKITKESGNKYLTSVYSERAAYAILDNAPSRTSLNNTYMLNFKLRLASESAIMKLGDGTNSIGLNNANFNITPSKWQNVEMVFDKPGETCSILIYEDVNGDDKYNSGDALAYYEPEFSTPINIINRIDFPTSGTNAIDDFKMIDGMYEVVPEAVVQSAVASIDIKSNNSKNITDAVNDGSDFTALDNFTLPTSAKGAEISWSSNDSHIAVNGANAVITPEVGFTGPVTLTATVPCGEASATVNFVVDLLDPQSVVNSNELTALNVLEYYKTKAVQIDLTDAVTPVMYDLYLPLTGDKNIEYKWNVSDSSIYTINGNEAKIMLSDTQTHNITLTCVISYVKDGVTYATKTCTYPLTVKYDANAAEAKAAAAAGSDNALLEEYKKTLHYNYQVRFDTACAENFAGIPSVAGVSTNSFDIKQTGIFGSTISWASNATSLKVSISSSKVNVTHPSNTSTATLTATVSAGTAEATTKSFDVSVTGTGSSSGGSGGGGGGYSGSNSTTTVTGPSSTQKPTVTPAPTDPNNAFDDIDGVKSWAGDAIAKLYKNGIVSGKADRIFEPYAAVTRAEFVKMLIGTLGLKSSIVTENRNFSDLPTNHWAYQYVQIAVAARIIEGYDASTFGTNDNITRQDMAVIVKRAADYAKLELPKENEAVAFSDASSIKDYATDAVTALQQANIINGNDNGTFDPLGAANRAQAAKVLAADVFWK